MRPLWCHAVIHFILYHYKFVTYGLICISTLSHCNNTVTFISVLRMEQPFLIFCSSSRLSLNKDKLWALHIELRMWGQNVLCWTDCMIFSFVRTWTRHDPKNPAPHTQPDMSWCMKVSAWRYRLLSFPFLSFHFFFSELYCNKSKPCPSSPHHSTSVT